MESRLNHCTQKLSCTLDFNCNKSENLLFKQYRLFENVMNHECVKSNFTQY